MTDRLRGAAGMTLVEVTVVLALSLPLLLVLASAARAVTGSFQATETSSGEAEIALRVVADVESVLRGGRRQSLQVVATRADVQGGRAAELGEWCPMVQGDPRSAIRIDTLTGVAELALQVAPRTSELVFVPDPDDRADGRDNDGDGLTDEGTLEWVRDGFRSVMAKNVEQCTFVLDGQAVRLTLGFAVVGHGRELRRTTIQHTVRLNNP